MLCALDKSVHSTHIVYGVECPCRGLHTLVMGLSVVAQISLHWCAVTVGIIQRKPGIAQLNTMYDRYIFITHY